MPEETAAPPAAKPAPHGRARSVALLVVPVATLAASAIGTGLAPTLLVESPATLIALDPRPAHLILTAPALTAFTYFAIAIVRWFVADPFLFAFGREHGPAAMAWLEPRSGPVGRWFIHTIVRSLDRFAIPIVFLFSGPLVCLLVGVQRSMTLRRFVAIDLVGSVVVLAALRAFGSRFAAPIAALTAFVAEHIAILTGVTCAFVALGLFIRWRRRTLGAHVASSD